MSPHSGGFDMRLSVPVLLALAWLFQSGVATSQVPRVDSPLVVRLSKPASDVLLPRGQYSNAYVRTDGDGGGNRLSAPEAHLTLRNYSHRWSESANGTNVNEWTRAQLNLALLFLKSRWSAAENNDSWRQHVGYWARPLESCAEAMRVALAEETDPGAGRDLNTRSFNRIRTIVAQTPNAFDLDMQLQVSAVDGNSMSAQISHSWLQTPGGTHSVNPPYLADRYADRSRSNRVVNGFHFRLPVTFCKMANGESVSYALAEGDNIVWVGLLPHIDPGQIRLVSAPIGLKAGSIARLRLTLELQNYSGFEGVQTMPRREWFSIAEMGVRIKRAQVVAAPAAFEGVPNAYRGAPLEVIVSAQ